MLYLGISKGRQECQAKTQIKEVVEDFNAEKKTRRKVRDTIDYT